jgi:hypothetical protein
MYRPTVRYDDAFKTFVDDMFHATSLDRNQILRAALFAAAHSETFQQILQPYMKKDAPAPVWSLTDDSFWLGQKGEKANDGSTKDETDDGDNGNDGRNGGRLQTVGSPGERRTGTFSSGPIRASIGGAVYQID